MIRVNIQGWLKNQIETLFSTKGNTSADNFTAIGKKNVVGLGNPDFTAAVDYTSNWGNDVTVQKSGWLWVRGNTLGGGLITLTIGTVTFNVFENGGSSVGIGSGAFFRIPPTKFNVTGGNGVSRQLFFYPCIGA